MATVLTIERNRKALALLEAASLESIKPFSLILKENGFTEVEINEILGRIKKATEDLFDKWEKMD